MGKIHLNFVPYGNDFFPGQVISGEVTYSRENRGMNLNGVYLEFIGYEYAVLNPTKTATKTLYQKKTLLFGPGKGIANFYLDPGYSAWPFQITIPDGLPPSFKHPSGKAKIVYEVRVEMDLPGAPNKVAQREINLHSVSPTQNLPAFDPPRASQTASIKGKQIAMQCSLSSATGVIGETVDIVAWIDNQSSKNVDSLKISFMQDWKTPSGSKELVNIKSYGFSQHFPVQPNGKFNGSISVRIPANVNPTLTTAHLFTLTYYITVECMVSESPICPVNLPIILLSYPPKPATVTQQTIPGFPVQMNPTMSIPPPYSFQPQMLPPQQIYPTHPPSNSMGYPQPNVTHAVPTGSHQDMTYANPPQTTMQPTILPPPYPQTVTQPPAYYTQPPPTSQFYASLTPPTNTKKSSRTPSPTFQQQIPGTIPGAPTYHK